MKSVNWNLLNGSPIHFSVRKWFSLNHQTKCFVSQRNEFKLTLNTHWPLTFPVWKHLVLTPSTREGGWADPLMIVKKVDSTNFNFGRPLWLSMRGKKTSRVDDLSLVRFPWQLIYVRVFSTKFCQKMTENNQSCNVWQSFRITAITLKTFRNNSAFYVLLGNVIYTWMGLPDFREGQVKNFG